MTRETEIETQMDSLGYLMQNYASYNLWANATLIYWLKSKPVETVTTHVPSSFPSIRETLLHILDTQSYWASVFSDLPIQSYSSNISSELLFEFLIDQSASISEFVETMEKERLIDTTMITNPWFECRFQNFEYIMQCINHSTYHRGQVVTIARQLGLTDAPNTDYNYYNVRGK